MKYGIKQLSLHYPHSKYNPKTMNWIALNNEDQINEINTISDQKFVLIFKHSTRCPTSSMALSRLERNWSEDLYNEITPYYLDLVQYRSISSKISTDYKVIHESPQIIIIKGGKSTFDTSHMAISVDIIKDQIH